MRLEQIGVVQTGCPAPDMLMAAGEGVLPESVERSVRFHLDSCRTCAMLRHELTASPLAEPTLEEMTLLWRRIQAGRRRAVRRLGVRYAAFAAGVAIMVMLPLAWEQEKPITPLQGKAASMTVPATASVTLPGCSPPVAKAPLRLPLATAMVMRGASRADEQRYLRELGRALAPYHADDFEKASARLERLASRYPRRVEPVFYLGVARLIGGHVEAAARALESAKGIGSEELGDDIATYLSAARQAAACNRARQ
jgi:hypothetical protein